MNNKINMSDLSINSSNLRGLAEAIIEHASSKATKTDDAVFKDFTAAVTNVKRFAIVVPRLVGKTLDVKSLLTDGPLLLDMADLDFEAISEDLKIVKTFVTIAAKRMVNDSKAEAGKFLLGIWVLLQGNDVDKEVCSRCAKQLCLHLDYYLDLARNGSEVQQKEINTTNPNNKKTWKDYL